MTEAFIFDALRTITPGAGGELQLTDAIAQCAAEGLPTHIVVHRGTRHDLGNPAVTSVPPWISHCGMRATVLISVSGWRSVSERRTISPSPGVSCTFPSLSSLSVFGRT